MARRQTAYTDINEALIAYCRSRGIIPDKVIATNDGKHRIIETNREKIYFLFKREPFYNFLSIFPHMSSFAESYLCQEYLECGDSMNFKCFLNAQFSHHCSLLVIVYGDSGLMFEGNISEIYVFCLNNKLLREQKDGEKTLSFPIGMLRRVRNEE